MIDKEFSACFGIYIFLFSLLGKFNLTESRGALFEITAAKDLKIFWNIPTFQCDYHRLNFTGLAEKFDINQNNNDRFRGEVIDILYDPGYFPAILDNGSKKIFRNGGLPQNGNLTLHLELFVKTVETAVEEDFSGEIVIDFESWRPIFRQNFGSLLPYKEYTIKEVTQAHPRWSKILIDKAATRIFEFSGQQFMEETIYVGKQLRKNATWGYYAYPYCFNMSPSSKKKTESCPTQVIKENDSLSWLFKIVDNYYPSLYMSENKLTGKEKLKMIEGRVAEADRIRRDLNKSSAKIYPYFWYKYQDTKKFLSKQDITNSFLALHSSAADGIVLWGSSDDVNSKAKCYELYNYIANVLGPALNLMRLK